MEKNDARGDSNEEPRVSLALWDYRRRVAGLYAAVRDTPDPGAAWSLWRSGRDELFSTHPMSAIPEDRRAAFVGLPYFAYDPSASVIARIESAPGSGISLPHSGDGSTPARSFGIARFALAGIQQSLTLYWLEEYGGGVFVPFSDGTNGDSTYGGGRYLLDTAKGADLGWAGDGIVLDFNFAYHPSCVHDPRWSCPLTLPENRLTIPVEAGERL